MSYLFLLFDVRVDPVRRAGWVEDDPTLGNNCFCACRRVHCGNRGAADLAEATESAGTPVGFFSFEFRVPSFEF